MIKLWRRLFPSIGGVIEVNGERFKFHLYAPAAFYLWLVNSIDFFLGRGFGQKRHLSTAIVVAKTVMHPGIGFAGQQIALLMIDPDTDVTYWSTQMTPPVARYIAKQLNELAEYFEAFQK